jgi:YggT family protein
MFVIANFIIAVTYVLEYILWAYMWIIIARVIISWVNADPYNAIVRFVYNATEPVLDRVRRVVPVVAGGLDLSPLVVWIAIVFLQRFLVQTLYDLARSLHYG